MANFLIDFTIFFVQILCKYIWIFAPKIIKFESSIWSFLAWKFKNQFLNLWIFAQKIFSEYESSIWSFLARKFRYNCSSFRSQYCKMRLFFERFSYTVRFFKWWHVLNVCQVLYFIFDAYLFLSLQFAFLACLCLNCNPLFRMVIF
mgnify:CR=1 FL=1